MRKINIKFLVIFLLVGMSFSYGQLSPPQWILEIVKDKKLEVVYGENYPYLNSFYGSGSPIIRGILNTGETFLDDNLGVYRDRYIQYVLFLARKKKVSTNEYEDELTSLVKNYTYHLVFATSKEYEGTFELVSVFDGFQLTGMHLHYGVLDKSLSDFYSLEDKTEKGPTKINVKDTKNTPIIVDYGDSVSILLYYKGNWLIYNEGDW